MRKIKFLALLILVAISLVSCYYNANSETSSATSYLESSQNKNNSDFVSKTENIASQTESQSEESIEPVIIVPGISLINDVYYLNFEEGNDYTETISGPYTELASLEFSSFSEFKSKVKNLSFTEPEKETMKKCFDKNEYGIIMCDTQNFYEPSWIPEGFDLEILSWDGGEKYAYINGDGLGSTVFFLYCTSDVIKINKQIAFEQGHSYEGLINNENVISVTDTVNEIDGIQHHIYDYKTKAGYDCRTSKWEFSEADTKYTICETYLTESQKDLIDKTKVKNMDFPLFVSIFADNGKESFEVSLSYMNIPITKEFVLKFGLKKSVD